MRNLMLLILICLVKILSGQNPLEDLKMKLEKKYVFETVDQFIDLGQELPVDVPIGVRDSADWIAARSQCAELYLTWYKGMSSFGYKIGDKSAFIRYEITPDSVETNEQIQRRITANTKVKYKKHAVSTFLDAEQRLKLFVKNSYKSKKRKSFHLELVQLGEPYEKLTEKIMRQVLDRELSFVLYENKIKTSLDTIPVTEAMVNLKGN